MLRHVKIFDLEKILRWRNAPDVRKVMFTDHVISNAEHLNWWRNIEKDNTRKILLFTLEGVDQGVINYFDIDEKNKSCHWGFYLSSDLVEGAQRIKAWQSLEKEAIKYAFQELGCERLICESFGFNKPVLEMHKRFGFVEKGVELHTKNGVQYEVVVTELSFNRYIQRYGLNRLELRNSSERIKESFKRLSVQVAFLSRSNMDFISAEFLRLAKEYYVDISITNIPFGQYMIEMNDSASDLCNKNHDFVFFMESMDDLAPFDSMLSEEYTRNISDQWDLYLNRLQLLRNKISGVFFVGVPVNISTWIMSQDVRSTDQKQFSLLKKTMKKQLVHLVDELTDVYILDFEALLERIGRDKAHPGKYRYLARSPFSAVFNELLSSYLLGMMFSLKGKTSRVIVLDLDNTLWKGVIGDDGIQGIVVGGDYPGNVYKVLQSLFLLLKKRGFALAIVSKNTESIAIDVFDNHPEMVLSLEDFATHRINWLPKPENIREIAAELGLGLDSVCFIDDNPVERAEMRSSVPEVFVPELPVEISDWPEYIANLPELASFNLTEEDIKRSESYKVRSVIKQASVNKGEREKFLASLDMTLQIEQYSKHNKQRVLQLINKTNQFNVTTHRYNDNELAKVLNEGECFAVRLIDNMGSDEIVGVVILLYEPDSTIIDTLLLSCRVLGRGVETALLHWITRYLLEKEINILKGEILPTERNKPVQNLYTNNGFSKIGESNFEMDLSKVTIDKPSWIKMK